MQSRFKNENDKNLLFIHFTTITTTTVAVSIIKSSSTKQWEMIDEDFSVCLHKQQTFQPSSIWRSIGKRPEMQIIYSK